MLRAELHRPAPRLRHRDGEHQVLLDLPAWRARLKQGEGQVLLRHEQDGVPLPSRERAGDAGRRR